MSTLGKELLKSARQAVALLNGDMSKGRITTVWVPVRVDVKSIRRKTGLSQAKFADRFGFKLSSVRDWEQKRRSPRGPSRALLTVIDREPEAVMRALRAG